jgi:hypothetical protein
MSEEKSICKHCGKPITLTKTRSGLIVWLHDPDPNTQESRQVRFALCMTVAEPKEKD